jgi:hypothetical protein
MRLAEKERPIHILNKDYGSIGVAKYFIYEGLSRDDVLTKIKNLPLVEIHEIYVYRSYIGLKGRHNLVPFSLTITGRSITLIMIEDKNNTFENAILSIT